MTENPFEDVDIESEEPPSSNDPNALENDNERTEADQTSPSSLRNKEGSSQNFPPAAVFSIDEDTAENQATHQGDSEQPSSSDKPHVALDLSNQSPTSEQVTFQYSEQMDDQKDPFENPFVIDQRVELDDENMYYDPYDPSLDQDADLDGPRRSASEIQDSEFIRILRQKLSWTDHPYFSASVTAFFFVVILAAGIALLGDEKKVFLKKSQNGSNEINPTLAPIPPTQSTITTASPTVFTDITTTPASPTVTTGMPTTTKNTGTTTTAPTAATSSPTTSTNAQTTSTETATCEYDTLEDLLLQEMNFDAFDFEESLFDAQQQAYTWLTNIETASPLNYCDKYSIIQKYVLAVLYFSADGRQWPLQMDFITDDADICSWNTIVNGTEFGILCQDEKRDDVVTEIRLFHNGLKGKIPTELGSLFSLQEINFDHNELDGSIPSDLGKLVELQTLMLTHNAIEGHIPKELTGLTEMEFLGLEDNMLTGTIPTEIGMMSKLIELRLDGNELEGTIPSEIGQLTNLITLDMFFNELKGTIPSEFANLASVRYLQVMYNKLTGTIPTEIGKMRELLELDLFFNELTGTIPTELGQMENLQMMELNNNALNGTLPAELGNLSNLNRLKLHQNKITGTVPQSYKKLKNLVDVDITWGNEIKGDIGILCEIDGLTIWIYCGQEFFTEDTCNCCTCWQMRSENS